MVAMLKLEGIDGKAPPGVELAAQFDSTRATSPDPSVFGDGQYISARRSPFLIKWIVVHGRS